MTRFLNDTLHPNSDRESIGLIGHFSAQLGVGEAARRLRWLLHSSGIITIPANLLINRSKKNNQSFSMSDILNTSSFITCVNPDQLAATISYFPAVNLLSSLHRGFWSWELEHFPNAYLPATELVDEIWTVSTFCERAIAAVTPKTVKAVRLPVPTPSCSSLSRDRFKLNVNDFVVTTSFDYFSDTRRKNPKAAVAAYLEAFPKEEDDAKLIIKSINANYFQTEHEELQKQVAGRRDISFISSNLTDFDNGALLAASNVFLSLHRSEGYGINLIDAMARGCTVVATGYSGNLDFMDEANSLLVPYNLESVSSYANVRVNSFWAEPDIDVAAKFLRGLYVDRSKGFIIGDKAKTQIAHEHGITSATQKFIREFTNAHEL
jgi:glycosyltransferase involved in cell wall biosynthesis